MSSPFIKAESQGSAGGQWALNLRLFGSLALFKKLIPLSFVSIVLASATPSVFRWYSGRLASTLPPHSITWGPLSFTVTATLEGLAWVAGFGIFFRVLAWAAFEISGMWASKDLHRRMVESLSRTRTTFYDENPSGRLINRLIRDYDELRTHAIIFVGDMLNALVEVFSIVVVAALASPWALLAIIPLLATFAYLQSQRAILLDHARGLSAIATSQVMGRKTDLIEGREIFALYGRLERLLERMSHGFSGYVRANILLAHIDTWGSLWIRMSAEGVSFLILVLTTWVLSRGEIDSTLAGVIISALFGISGSIGWLDFATGYVSRAAPHVRRVFEYIDLPPEESEELAPDRDAARSRPPAHLGDSPGGIEFVNYSMSYRRDTPIILSGLNLKFPAGSKTALIGRTGSGKTSLTQALLRMVYVHGGDITLGGRSIFDWDVRKLRRMFGVVPQFPYLFEGTVRSNLDRAGERSAAELEAALRTVGLTLSLDQSVKEGGANLSLGERQLICLARVLAARRPIVLMDEPTSGLDPQTDARISEILHTALRDCTVITIAHRRESLHRYDAVIEMSAGAVVSPQA